MNNTGAQNTTPVGTTQDTQSAGGRQNSPINTPRNVSPLNTPLRNPYSHVGDQWRRTYHNPLFNPTLLDPNQPRRTTQVKSVRSDLQNLGLGSSFNLLFRNPYEVTGRHYSRGGDPFNANFSRKKYNSLEDLNTGHQSQLNQPSQVYTRIGDSPWVSGTLNQTNPLRDSTEEKTFIYRINPPDNVQQHQATATNSQPKLTRINQSIDTGNQNNPPIATQTRNHDGDSKWPPNSRTPVFKYEARRSDDPNEQIEPELNNSETMVWHI